MNPKSTQVALVESALAAIEQVLALIHHGGAVPFFSPSELSALPTDAQEAARRAEEQIHREQPEYSALHLCLVSASALLDVSQILMNRQLDPSAAEPELALKTIANHTKVAGRSAYRAALILTDPPRADIGSHGLARTPPGA